jgi:hypothetical protein
MTQMNIPLKVRGFGETLRRDAWWAAPAATLAVLTAFLIYAHWVVLTQHNHYFLSRGGANYLSPFYSPLAFDSAGQKSGHAWLSARPAWLPLWVTPAALILIFPAGFRFTCYYYRGAYYKAFWADPPSCAVGEPRNTYWGEATLPLIIQNVHRYFMYAALIFIVILAYDAIVSYKFYNEARTDWRFGVGVGSLVLTLNVVLLSGYTLGCHSLRHLIGGYVDHLSRRPTQKKLYDCVSCLNRRHMLWAWMSLIWVGFSDIYVRLCSMGVWTDLRLF